MANTDAFLHTPMKNVNYVSDYIQLLSVTDELPVSADMIRKETSRNLVLSKVLQYKRHGCPSKVTEEALMPYFARRYELSIHNDCIT